MLTFQDPTNEREKKLILRMRWTTRTNLHLRKSAVLDVTPGPFLQVKPGNVWIEKKRTTLHVPDTPTTTTIYDPIPTDDQPPSLPPDLPPDNYRGEQQLQQIDPAFRPQPDEDFKAKRARYEQQETISYKQPSPDTDATTYRPERRHDQAAPTSPYSNKPIDDAALSP